MTAPQQSLTSHIEGAWNAPHRSDSFRAPMEGALARNEWEPVPISQLGPAEPPEWIWPGYIAKGHTTLFTALWKSGKTTLIGHLLKDLAAGGGLVPGPTPMLTLVITEESAGMWSRRRDALGLTDRVHILSRPFMTKPDTAKWYAFLEHIARLVAERGYGLVVFDTLPSLWPVLNENDAAEVGAALMPINTITEAGAGVLLVHHPRKGGGDEAQGSRGSGALPGFVDVIVEMRRNSKEDLQDRRRVLSVLSRLNDEATESVIELGENGYQVLGERRDVTKEDRFGTIAAFLPSEGEGWTVEEVLEHWPTQPPPGKRSLQTDLSAGALASRWRQFGKGRKNDPYRYSLAVFDSRKAKAIGARIESAPLAPPGTGGGT